MNGYIQRTQRHTTSFLSLGLPVTGRVAANVSTLKTKRLMRALILDIILLESVLIGVNSDIGQSSPSKNTMILQSD